MESTYVGKFLNGKEVVDTSEDSKFMYFYFEDKSYDVAPIIDGIVSVTFDAELPENVEIIPEEEGEPSADPLATTEEEIELGFYKTLQPIPYTDEEGNEVGMTEVGSIQEVPVAVGDLWVAEGWAEKVEQPAQVGLGAKVAGAFSGLLGKK